MPLPINIDELISGKTVEWERIEFRQGWNPQRTLHSICAFANDFNNWGGGYIILGIAEDNGKPVLPPEGLQLNQIDSIQQELNQICRKILPNYFPIVEPVDFQTIKILILWCPGGSNRPYKAPELLSPQSQHYYYIRRMSSTVRPTQQEERELFSMSNQVPFDDQINHHATINDFDLTIIKAFLNETKSSMMQVSPHLSLDEISRNMNIAEGPNENFLPKNIGLLFFGLNPQSFFPSAKIEIITFDTEAGDSYIEKIFKGPIHLQLRSAFQYFKDNIIQEKVVKVSDKAESKRFFNYPFDAIEEALSNAVYHRGYDDPSTIEVRIYPSRIEILSYPGPLPPLNKKRIQEGNFTIRKYRNRRIGELLKELHLTEGRATGIPTIKKSLADNSSPNALFETDDDRTYFLVQFKINPNFVSMEQAGVRVRVQVEAQANLFVINNLKEIFSLFDTYGVQVKKQVRKQVGEQVEKQKIEKMKIILSFCKLEKKRNEILAELGLTNRYANYNNYIVPLIENDLLERTEQSTPRSPNQKYRTTRKGNKLFEILDTD